MIVCQQCGYQNDDDDQFCGGCPGYLPHVGLLVEDDVELVAEPEAERAEENPTGLVQRVKAIVLGDDDTESSGSSGGDGHGSVAVRDTEEAQAAAEESAAIDAAERAAIQEAARTAAAERRAAEEREAAAEAERKAEEAERVAAEAARRAAASEATRAQAAQAAKVEAEEAAAAARAETASREAAKASEAARVEAARVEAARAEQAEAARISAADAVRSTAADVAREVEEERKTAEAISTREAEAARRAEEDRKAAEEAAAREAEAARKAEHDRKAAEEAERLAEEDRRAAEEAERKAEEERKAAKEAAERSRRAAAMVAKAPPPPPAPAPGRRPQKAARPTPTAAPAAAAAVPTEAADAPVTARRPAASERRAPKGKTRPSRVIEPGDLVCGQCGEPNKPERKFCRRCAHSLQEAKVAKLPWWRRLFTGRKKKVAAGERPGRAGRVSAGSAKGASHKAKKAGRKLKWAVRSVAMLATLLVGIGLLGPWRGPVQERVEGVYQSVRSRIAPEFVTVTVAETRASSELPEHPALHATDGADNRHWVAGTAGEGQFLVVRFAEPVHLRRIGFLAGASGDQFLSHPRPRELHLVYDTGGSDDLELTDQPEFQVHKVDAEGVQQVEVHIRSLHPSTEGNNQVAITNIQFSTAK